VGWGRICWRVTVSINLDECHFHITSLTKKYSIYL
jgi:hypothetical protein